MLDKIVAISNNDHEIVLKVNNTRDQNFSSDSLIALADLLLGQGYYEYADKIYDLILKVSPSSSHALYKKGLAHLSMGNYEESLSLFDSVINLKQEYVADAYTSRAAALDYLNRPEEAERFYALAQEAYSNRIKRLTEEVLSFQNSGDYKESLKPVEQILTIEPNNRYGMYLKALAFYNLKEYEESVPAFEKYIELDPNNVQALFYLGNASISLGQYDNAIKIFDQIISIKQKAGVDDADSRYYKGNALLSLERLFEAEEEYKKALSMYEKSEETDEKRISTLEKLRSIYSNYPDYFKFDESLLISKKIVDLDKTNNIRLKLMLSEDLIKTNNIVESKKILKEIKEYPSNDGRYKKIHELLILCSNFLDSDTSNDNSGMKTFHEFLSSEGYDNSEIKSDFWNFNGIQQIIKDRPETFNKNKKEILLQIIDSFQDKEKRKIVKDSITSYFSYVIEEQKKQYKKLIRIGGYTIVALIALFAVPSIYYATFEYTEYPPIVLPTNTVDWIINSEHEKLYYITNEKDSTKEGKFKGQFVEYDIRREHLDAIRSHLSSISGENLFINGFLDLVFPGKPVKEPPIDIHANPIMLIHDDKKDITFITLENERELIVIKNGKPIRLSVPGFPTDVKFDDIFIYVSTYNPNELSVFNYTVLEEGSLENEDKVPMKTLSLKYTPNKLALDESNNTLFLINSDSTDLSVVDLSQGILGLKFEDVYYINLMEKKFRPGVVLFDEDGKKLIIQNVISRDLIILNVTNPHHLSNNINGYFEEHKELFPLKSNKAYIDDGVDNSLFISSPDTKIIYKLIFGNEGDKTIYQHGIKTGVNQKLIFDEKTKKLFVESFPEYKIERIDSDLNNPSDYVDVERDPFSMKFDNVSSILYVTNSKDNSISIVDADKDSALDTIPIEGYWPNDIAFDNKENKIFVVNSHFDGTTYGNDSSIFIINNATKKSLSDKKYDTKFVPLKNLPGSTSIGVNPMNKKIYVSNIFNQTVSVLDYAGKILNKIPVGNRPVGIEVNPHRNLVYVANYEDDTLSIINSTNDTVIQNLIVGQGPHYVAVLDKSKIIVLNDLSDSVSVIDVVDGSNNKFYHKVVNTVLVRKDPYSFAYPVSADYYNGADRRLLYVINSDNRISVINPDNKSNIFPVAEIPFQVSRVLDPSVQQNVLDPRTQNVTTSVYSNLNTSEIAINPKNGNIYISSSDYDMLFKYDVKKSKENKINYHQIESIQTGKFPYGIKIDQNTGNVYVPSFQSEYVQVFSRNNSLISEIKVPDLSYIDIDQYTSELYISHKHSGIISKYKYISETNEFQNIGNISVGYSPSAIFVDEDFKRLLVSGDNKLKAYDLYNHTLLTASSIPIGLSANSIAIDQFANIIYINDPIENEFTIIDGINYKPFFQNKPDFSVLGTYPSSIAVSQEDGSVYISHKNSDAIENIWTGKNIHVGNSPVVMSINENIKRLYVANEKSSDVYIIDTESNQILDIIKVGYYPNAIDVNLKTNDVYITSAFTNNIFKFHDDTT